MDLVDVLELIEVTQDTLDDIWKQSEHKIYPEARMKHLMEIIGEKSTNLNVCVVLTWLRLLLLFYLRVY